MKLKLLFLAPFILAAPLAAMQKKTDKRPFYFLEHRKNLWKQFNQKGFNQEKHDTTYFFRDPNGEFYYSNTALGPINDKLIKKAEKFFKDSYIWLVPLENTKLISINNKEFKVNAEELYINLKQWDQKKSSLEIEKIDTTKLEKWCEYVAEEWEISPEQMTPLYKLLLEKTDSQLFWGKKNNTVVTALGYYLNKSNKSALIGDEAGNGNHLKEILAYCLAQLKKMGVSEVSTVVLKDSVDYYKDLGFKTINQIALIKRKK